MLCFSHGKESSENINLFPCPCIVSVTGINYQLPFTNYQFIVHLHLLLKAVVLKQRIMTNEALFNFARIH